MKKKEFKYKFSIIVPIYNAEDYLSSCIESVIKQKFNFKEVQLILVNDGSRDTSRDICNFYRGDYDNILYIEQENKGVSAARNNGIKHALGKYILFLDSDDMLEKTVLKKLYSFFESVYDKTDVVVYPFKYLMPDKKYRYNFRYKSLYKKGTYVYDIEKYPEIIQATVNYCIKNKYDDTNLFNEEINFSEDEEYATRLIMEKRKIAYLKDCYYIYRRHEKSANGKYIMTQEVFDKFTSYYDKLLKTYDRIPYIQYLFLNTLRWRILDNKLWPVDVSLKKHESNLKKIEKILKNIDTSCLINLSSINNLHKVYIAKLKGCNITTKVKNDSCLLYVDDLLLCSEKKFKCLIDKISVEDKKLFIKFVFISPFFEYVKPKINLIYNNQDVKVKLEKSSYSNYKSSYETNLVYEFEKELDFKGNIIDLDIIVDKKIYKPSFMFSTQNLKFMFDKKYLFNVDNDKILISSKKIIDQVKLYGNFYGQKIVKKIRG